MEEKNQSSTPGQTVENQPEVSVAPTQSPQSVVPEAPKTPGSKTKLIVIIVLVLLIAGGVAAFFIFRDNGDKTKKDAVSEQTVDQTKADDKKDVGAEGIDCGDAYTAFANKDFGMAFCYPSEWGTATVRDAKLDPSDTGYRQTVAFSRNQQFSVGGVSDDWTTTIGQGVGCLAPYGTVTHISEYNTEWHDITDEFAQRSLESSVGGYSMTEMVGEFDGGVCARGGKVIDGSRYKVASAGYSNSFTAGVATVAAHMADPYVLFGETDRTEYDKLLASIRAY